LIPANAAANVPLTVTLSTGAFSDPDAGDTHQQTEWQVSTVNDFSSTVLSTLSNSHLTSLTVPNGNLTWGKTYYWRVRFYDNRFLGSLWSDTRSFITVVTTNDLNGNGIPDAQEVGSSVDLNGNGIPDVNESDMKSLKTVVGSGQMGVSRKIDPTVTAIGSIESIDPASVSNAARPYLPLGIMSMDLTVFNPANPGEVTVYFSQAAPANTKWYVYSSIEGWLDFSKQATFSADRKSVRLKLKDWGYGDSDGLPNGKILDPGGFGIASWIKGTVTDASTGEKITDAEIRISGLILKSLLEGNYLSMIHPGTFDITVSATRYDTLTLSNVEIPIGNTVTKNIALARTKPKIESPVFSPQPGTYGTAKNVSITCPTPGATSYYTTNGSDPTESSFTYVAPIQISKTTTLKAKAYMSGLTASDVTSGTYIFSGTMGDLNGNGPADLADAILALKIVGDMAPAAGDVKADVNGDGKIGLQEAIYILQKVGGQR
jgi:hypothetical protein